MVQPHAGSNKYIEAALVGIASNMSELPPCSLMDGARRDRLCPRRASPETPDSVNYSVMWSDKMCESSLLYEFSRIHTLQRQPEEPILQVPKNYLRSTHVHSINQADADSVVMRCSKAALMLAPWRSLVTLAELAAASSWWRFPRSLPATNSDSRARSVL